MGCNHCHTAVEDGAARSRAGYDTVPVWPSGADWSPTQREGAEPFVWSGFREEHRVQRAVGHQLRVNLTPEPNTGIGIWTEEMFVKTMRTGRHMGGRVRSCRRCRGGVSEHERRRSEGGLRVPAHDQAD